MAQTETMRMDAHREIATEVAYALGSALHSIEQLDTEDVNGWGVIHSYDITLETGQSHLLYLAPNPATTKLTLDTSATLQIGDGETSTLAWLYPNDPALPALANCVTLAGAEQIMATLGDKTPLHNKTALRNNLPKQLSADSLAELELVGYRPSKRAVLRATFTTGMCVYLKVVPPASAQQLAATHTRLRKESLPVPEVLAWSPAGLIVLQELPGIPISQSMLETEAIANAIQVTSDLLATLPRDLVAKAKPPVTTVCNQYASTIAEYMPPHSTLALGLATRINEVIDAGHIKHAVPTKCAGHSGRGGNPPEQLRVPIHGDLHSEQIFVDTAGQVTGVLDLERLTLGCPEDDLAVFAAHEHVRLSLFDLDAQQRKSAESRLRAATSLSATPAILGPRIAAMLIAHAASFAVAADHESVRVLLDLAQSVLDRALSDADENSLTLVSPGSHQGS